MKNVRSTLPLCVACVLAPWIAGQVSVDAQPLSEGLFGSILGGWLPLTSRFLLGLLVFGGLGWRLLSRRSLQLPVPRILGLLGLFVLWLGASLAWSRYFAPGLNTWLSWSLFAGATVLAVSSAGRISGVRCVLVSIVAGTAIVAATGILQYAAVRAQEPTFRIFAGWNNPNALAGILMVGLVASLAVGATVERTSRLAVLSLAAPITLALALTQSKGGYLAAGLGILAFAVLAALFGVGKRLAPSAIALVVGVVLVFAMQFSTPKSAPSGTPFARISAAAETQDQSVTFRKNLWKGAIELARRSPLGLGLGSYRFLSASTGETTQTVFAHQSYLQLASESGWLAPALLVALFGSGLLLLLRGVRAMTAENRLVRAGIFGALVAIGANGFIESNLYMIGTGFVAFVLLGLALQVSPEGASPEFVGKEVRIAAALLFCAIPLAGLAWSASVEVQKARLLASTSAQEANARAEALTELAPFDGEAWNLRALVADPSYRVGYLERSFRLQPTTRVARSLAREYARTGDLPKALALLHRALELDPNNLPILALVRDLYEQSGEENAAVATAWRILEVEKTPYFQVRAIAELVPAEPLDARLYLAKRSRGQERARLLREAIQGYVRFAQLTVPQVVKMATASPPLPFAGIDAREAREILEKGLEAIELAALDQGADDTIETSREVLEAARASLP